MTDRIGAEALRALLREGCDLLSVEVDALRSGISVCGVISTAPEDEPTREDIAEFESWILRAGRAAMAGKDG